MIIRPEENHKCKIFFNFDYFNSYGCKVGNKTDFIKSSSLTEEAFQEKPIINWDAILWVDRPPELWIIQLILAIVSLAEALLIAYLGYKVWFD
jgi:potassium channel subfamily T protein 1